VVLVPDPHEFLEHKLKFEVGVISNIRRTVTFIYLADHYSIRRLDLLGQPHRNPSLKPPSYLYDQFGDNQDVDSLVGMIVDCPHIHPYVALFHDKWAIPMNWEDAFRSFTPEASVLDDFLVYCQITGIQVVSDNNLFGN